MVVASPNLNTTLLPKHIAPKEPYLKISSSLTPKQVAKNALKERAEMEAQIKYLQTQLGQLMEEKRRSLRNSRSPTE